jgi:hypothetical protein
VRIHSNIDAFFQIFTPPRFIRYICDKVSCPPYSFPHHHPFPILTVAFMNRNATARNVKISRNEAFIPPTMDTFLYNPPNLLICHPLESQPNYMRWLQIMAMSITRFWIQTTRLMAISPSKPEPPSILRQVGIFSQIASFR